MPPTAPPFGSIDQGLERHAQEARLLIENGHTTNGRENRRFPFCQTPRPLGKKLPPQEHERRIGKSACGLSSWHGRNLLGHIETYGTNLPPQPSLR